MTHYGTLTGLVRSIAEKAQQAPKKKVTVKLDKLQLPSNMRDGFFVGVAKMQRRGGIVTWTQVEKKWFSTHIYGLEMKASAEDMASLWSWMGQSIPEDN